MARSSKSSSPHLPLLGLRVSLDDTVAAQPGIPSCHKRADEGVASLEFFSQSGPDPLILVGPEEPCPLIGLPPLDAKPIPVRGSSTAPPGVVTIQVSGRGVSNPTTSELEVIPVGPCIEP